MLKRLSRKVTQYFLDQVKDKENKKEAKTRLLVLMIREYKYNRLQVTYTRKTASFTSLERK